MLEAAREEIAAVAGLDNSREIESVLDKYADYPDEILGGPYALLQMHKDELRRAMIGKVEAAMHSMDTTLVDGLLQCLLSDFGNEMDPFAEMLRARRDKMISLINERMRRAVQAEHAHIPEIDSIFHDALPLVRPSVSAPRFIGPSFIFISGVLPEKARLHLCPAVARPRGAAPPLPEPAPAVDQVHEMDEVLWNALRAKRDGAVRQLRLDIKDALSHETPFDGIERLIVQAETCKQELPEEWSELAEHRAYLLEEAQYVAESAQPLLSQGDYRPEDFEAIR
jgi:hypothetical protein